MAGNHVIRPARKKPAKVLDAEVGEVDPEGYWLQVLNDRTATPRRRDRAAEMLTLYYRGQPAPKGVRSQAKADARDAVASGGKFAPATPPQGH